MTSEWIDISIPIHDRMVHWPDDPEIRIERILDVAAGDSHTLSVVSMGSHTGTHMDAPLHFLRTGQGIDQMPFAATVGPARVIEISDPQSIKPEELDREQIQPGERILFKTQNSSRCWKTDAFVKDFVYLSTEAAHFLVGRGVRTIGIDYLSVGGYEKNGSAVHRTLLESGIWIIEGLDLSAVQPGIYELICLPLKILSGDGAPARAILRSIGTRSPRTV